MEGFEKIYHALNAAQRQAVDTIDGPLLVIAGPGTGKTQLLSARIANILQKTDTPPRNILALTFTETGAENMRDRLSRLIGSAAYDIAISTYHAFGSQIINRFPQYFNETRLEEVIDELTQRQIVTDIVERMRYTNPLKQTRHHENDLISTMSEVKRALLTADDLRLIAAENLLYIKQVNRDFVSVFENFTRVSGFNKAMPLFERVLQILADNAPAQPVNTTFGSLAQVAVLNLRLALDQASEAESTKSLTEWKNDWLVKDGDNKLVFDGELASQRIAALADVLDQYEAALSERGLYDYDDMIVRVIRTLEHYDDLRFTLQEQYQYILLDEFQDTNTAQLRLVHLLSSNPVSEGRPNIMAVGDDDQAIYAFQGALYSNMLDFYRLYKDVQVVNLTENYRSHPEILQTAGNVIEQVGERLYPQFNGASKTLTAENKNVPKTADIERRAFLSDIAQADWVARKIKRLVEAGTKPSEVAILAPKHRQLEPLVPYLNAQQLPVRYEKRENILDAPVVKQLLTMSRLVLALHDNDEAAADNLWPEVLSYDFWNLSTSSIWEMSWQVSDERQKAAASGKPGNTTWSKVLVADGKRFRLPALLFLTLANYVGQESGETMMDYLTGSTVIDTREQDLPRIASPLRDYYTSDRMRQEEPELFYETVSHLTVLRARLREHQKASESALSLRDMVAFVDMYLSADERMINSSPYNQAADSVQVMTVFKAKGLEFAHVFLLNMQDDVWGTTSRSQNNRISLPENLIPIRHAGLTEDERLRILYVALTRAKYGLYLTSVGQTYTGKATHHLKYLLEQENEAGQLVDLVLPTGRQIVHSDDHTPPSLEMLELDWRRRHMAALQQTDLRALLQPRLNNYRVSPTHLGQFLDLEYAGPERFFLTNVLRFPEAPTTDIQFGNAIHETLQWVQEYVSAQGVVPSTAEALEYFATRMRAKKLTAARTSLEIERGERALAAFLAARKTQYKPLDRAEVGFRHDGVTLGDAQLSGKIDRLEIDHTHKTITVVDYKTGKGYMRWQQDTKLHKYRRQLYAYKLLVEHAASFAGYTVTGGRLEFVEPDSNGRIDVLDLNFTQSELEHTRKLLIALWHHVQQLQFPDVSQYDANLTGMKQFEQDLIDNKI